MIDSLKKFIWWLQYIFFLKEVLIDKWFWSDVSWVKDYMAENLIPYYFSNTPYTLVLCICFFLQGLTPRIYFLVKSGESMTLW